MFTFVYVERKELPRLAWCARVPKGGGAVVVEHGAGVECRPQFFVEGAWNGTFGSGNFGDTEILLGSGGRVVGPYLWFVPTTHTMERLQSVIVGDFLFLSNSFTYLLTATSDAPDLQYRYYERDFLTFLRGYRKAQQTVPTQRGRTVRLHYHRNIVIDDDLKIENTSPPEPQPFRTFDEYLMCLHAILGQVVANASDRARHLRYELLSSISTGYDSPACTVIARDVGCRRAVTFRDARPDRNSSLVTTLEDGGSQIGNLLGIEVIEFARDEYQKIDDLPEAEFIAAGNGGDDVIFAAMGSELRQKVFVTGFLGDTLWGTSGHDPECSKSYQYAFPAGGSFSEFRLRVGFIHAPIPLLTFTLHQHVLAITHSDEMAQWRVGGDYDRPIPRRLIETQGIPRSLYAQEKKAVSQPFWLAPDVRRMLTQRSLLDLEDFARVADSKGPGGITGLRYFGARQFLRFRNWLRRRAPNVGRRVAKATGLRMVDLRRRTLSMRLNASPTNSLKFHWAVARTTDRYRASRLEHELPLQPDVPRRVAAAHGRGGRRAGPSGDRDAGGFAR